MTDYLADSEHIADSEVQAKAEGWRLAWLDEYRRAWGYGDDADADTYADTYANANAYADANADAYADAYAFANSDADAFADTNAYANSDANANADAFADTNAYANSDADAFTDAYANADANANADAFADTEIEALNAKLTDELVREIRASTETQRVIAARLGVDRSLISRIRTRQGWAHVTEVTP